MVGSCYNYVHFSMRCSLHNIFATWKLMFQKGNIAEKREGGSRAAKEREGTEGVMVKTSERWCRKKGKTRCNGIE